MGVVEAVVAVAPVVPVGDGASSVVARGVVAASFVATAPDVAAPACVVGVVVVVSAGLGLGEPHVVSVSVVVGVVGVVGVAVAACAALVSPVVEAAALAASAVGGVLERPTATS